MLKMIRNETGLGFSQDEEGLAKAMFRAGYHVRGIQYGKYWSN